MSTDKVAGVLEALISGIEEAMASGLLSEAEKVEVLEGLQVELDGMLERLIAEGGEDPEGGDDAAS